MNFVTHNNNIPLAFSQHKNSNDFVLNSIMKPDTYMNFSIFAIANCVTFLHKYEIT